MEGEDTPAGDAPADTGTDTDTDTGSPAPAEGDPASNPGEAGSTPAAGSTPEPPAPDPLATWGTTEWAKALLEDQDRRGTYEVTQEELDGLPIEAKRVLAALHHKSAKAMGDIEKLKSDAQASLDAAEARERKALLAQAEALKWVDHKSVTDFVAKMTPTGEQPDPETPEGVKWLAQQAAAEMVAGFLESIKSAGAERDTAAKAAEAESAREQRKAVVAAYMAKYPGDFEEGSPVYTAVVDLLKRTNYAIPMEEAHQLILGRLQTEELTRTHSEELKGARARVVKTGVRGPVIPRMPKEYEGDTEAMNKWWSENPDAMKRDLAELKRTDFTKL